MVRHDDDAINFRSLTMTARSTGSINDYERPCSNELVTLGEGDCVLNLSSLSDAFSHQISGNLTRKVNRIGAIFFGVGKEASPIELSGF